jgi:hypothetical protein
MLENNIKIDLKEVGWKVVGWSHLSLDRDKWLTVVNMIMNCWVS